MNEENTLYPGRPNYTGPTRGLFGLLHHDQLAEWSDGVMERVAYVQNRKPRAELAIRLASMVYLELDRLPAELDRARAEWDRAQAELDRADAEWRRTDAEWRRARAEWDRACAEWGRACAEHAPAIEAVIRELVPGVPWRDGALRFDESEGA